MIKHLFSEVTIGALSKLVGFALFSWVLTTYGFNRSTDQVVLILGVIYSVIGVFGSIFYATVFIPISTNNCEVSNDLRVLVNFYLVCVVMFVALVGIAGFLTILYFDLFNDALKENAFVSLMMLFFGLVYELLSQVMKARLKYAQNNLIFFSFSVLSVIFVILYVSGPELLLYWAMITFSFSSISLVFIIFREYTSRNYQIFSKSDYFTELLRRVPPLLMQSIISVFSTFAPLLISFSVGAGVASQYSLIRRVYDVIISLVVVPTVSVLSPLLHGRGRSVKRSDIETILLFLFIPASILPFFFLSYIERFFEAYFQTDYEVSIGLSIVLLSITANCLHAIFTRSVLQKGDIKALYKMNLLAVVPALTLPPVTYFFSLHFGLVGICAAFSAYHLIIHLPLSFYLDYESYGISGARRLISIIIWEVVSIIFYGACVIVVFPTNEYDSAFFYPILCLFFYILYIGLRIFLQKSLRTKIYNLYRLKIGGSS